MKVQAQEDFNVFALFTVSGQDACLLSEEAVADALTAYLLHGRTLGHIEGTDDELTVHSPDDIGTEAFCLGACRDEFQTGHQFKQSLPEDVRKSLEILNLGDYALRSPHDGNPYFSKRKGKRNFGAKRKQGQRHRNHKPAYNR